ncbi:hypothetical protein ACQ4PT_067149 [Festuca glaucescens]
MARHLSIARGHMDGDGGGFVGSGVGVVGARQPREPASTTAMAESSSPPQHPVTEANANYVGIPGVRFVPSDEELILDYLRAKLNGEEQPTKLVRVADVYGKHPKELTDNLGGSVEGFWYVFSERQRKYPKGKRPSRSTGTAGRWKTVGKNVAVSFGADKRIIGHKCALAYELFVRSENQSRPRMVKTEWKMCEFVAEGTDKPISSAPTKMMLNDWVLCRITRKGEADEILELEDGGQATLVEEAYEEEELQDAAPPDPSQQAQVQVQVQDLVDDGADGTEVGTQGFDADVEPPIDGDCLMDAQLVDCYHQPEVWGTEDEDAENFAPEQWNAHGNQFRATAGPDPMVNQLGGVPTDPDGGQATLVEEAYEDEELQNATPPDPSQQAQAQDLAGDGEDGSDGTKVGTQGFVADAEPPIDHNRLTDVHLVDCYHQPDLWVTQNECGEDFYHDPWNFQGNQFEATIDLEPMANQLVVPAEPDLGVLSLSEVVPTDPEPWDSASALLFPDDNHEPVMDEIVKPDVDTGKDKSKDNNTAANKPPRQT